MALSLDDRLLGEKAHNYCSSSEGSDSEGDDGERRGSRQRQQQLQLHQESEQQHPREEPRDWSGSATNTGPKGVVADWRRYKQLEAESRAEQEAERLALAARFSVACRTAAEDQAAAVLDAELEAAMSEVDSQEFLAQYRQQRLEEMRLALAQRKLFGRVAQLDRGNFVRQIDSESGDVKILVHIYDTGEEPACVAVNAAFEWLAARYPTVKFCRIQAGQASVSRRFVERGLPAIVVYKAGEVTNSFVRLAKDLGEACTCEELEAFLTEYGVLSEALLSDGQTVQQLLTATGQQRRSQGTSSDVADGGKIRGPIVDASRRQSDSDSD